MAKTWAKSLNMWCGRYQSRFLAAGGACFCEGGRIVTLWAALTVLDAVREYRGPRGYYRARYALRYML